jgi:hypothetical protein
MGKNLFISGSILLLLAGFIFLAALTAGMVYARVDPLQVAQSETLIPVKQDELPPSENLSEISSNMDKELNQLEEEVISIRQLMPDETIYRNTLDADGLRERVITDFFADYTDEDIKRDTTVYALLGVIEPDFDLYSFIIDLYSEQIAGFYDDNTKEMVVVQGGDFGGPERMTYAHEFTHLLQDQTYGLEDGLNLSQELLDKDMDAYAARQALVEGDAVMTEYLWYQLFATDEDNLDVQQFATELSTPIYDSAPGFLKNELLFPYQFGLEFVHTIYVEQGWEGVQNLYANPPLSTEQIMHPERYPDDVPQTVSLDGLASAIPEGWDKIADSTFGEAYMYQLLLNNQDSQFIDISNIWEAAKGWGGDHYQIYMDENDDVIFVLRTIWDTENDAEQFSSAFTDYAKTRWTDIDLKQDSGFQVEDAYFHQVRFMQTGSETWWIVTPDGAITDAVIAAMQMGVE